MIIGLYKGFDYPILLKASDKGLSEISFPKDNTGFDVKTISPPDIFDNEHFKPIFDQFDRYFQGNKVSFDVALDIQSGTSFQRKVWQVLKNIPYGQTRSYLEIARLLDMPGAQRAIGQANGANPVPIIVPCHRVIASDKSIGGYSGGIEIKRALLALEGFNF